MRKKTENWVIRISLILTVALAINTFISFMIAFYNGQTVGDYRTIIYINSIGEAVPELLFIVIPFLIFGSISCILILRRELCIKKEAS